VGGYVRCDAKARPVLCERGSRSRARKRGESEARAALSCETPVPRTQHQAEP